MFRLAIASVAAHKLRLVLTSLAIVLGVAFVAGSFVLTDTINARFTILLGEISSGTDVYVRPLPPDFGNDFGQVFPSMPEETLETVLAVEGVAVAEGTVEGLAQLIDKEGNPVGGQGPPTLGFSWGRIAELSPVSIADGDGRGPEGPGEVVIDRASARILGAELGDTIEIVATGPSEEFTLVGIAGFGETDNLAGATLAAFEYSEAQRVLNMPGAIGSINVAAAEGVDADELALRLQEVLPDGIEAITVENANAQQSEEIGEALSFVTIGLLSFAAVAVFVGAFIISTTFRIIIAQRTRELALLRAVGATASQVTRLVMIEALFVALFSSVLGILAGVGLATGINGIMRALNFGLPEGPLTLLPRTIIVGMVVGVVVTLVSAIIPARKAARVPPVAAMSALTARPTRKALRGRAISGGAVLGLGALVLAIGLFISVSNAIWFVALGALSVFAGISILAPLFARPITAVVGWPLPRLFGVPGKLAAENTRRQPRRTASTASALMIGVALVVFVAVFASSIKASAADVLVELLPSDLTISSTNFATGVSPQYSEDLRELPEISEVTALAVTQVKVDEVVYDASVIEPETVGGLFDLEVSDESLADLEATDGVLISSQEPGYEAWIGSTIDIELPTGVVETAEVVGSFDVQNFGTFLLTRDRYAAGVDTFWDSFVAANVAEGVSIEAARTAAEDLAMDYPNVQVQTVSEVLADAESQIDQILVIFTVLLAFAIIIAVLGITNTLALSIIERTHEIGLLRAVGMVRRQVRRMIRWEGVVGAVLGILTGLLLGWAVVQALADEGLGQFSIPFVQLAIYIVIAALAGVIAAAYPARKAARLNVLEAIAYE